MECVVHAALWVGGAGVGYVQFVHSSYDVVVFVYVLYWSGE